MTDDSSGSGKEEKNSEEEKQEQEQLAEKGRFNAEMYSFPDIDPRKESESAEDSENE